MALAVGVGSAPMKHRIGSWACLLAATTRSACYAAAAASVGPSHRTHNLRLAASPLAWDAKASAAVQPCETLPQKRQPTASACCLS